MTPSLFREILENCRDISLFMFAFTGNIAMMFLIYMMFNSTTTDAYVQAQLATIRMSVERTNQEVLDSIITRLPAPNEQAPDKR